MNWRKFLAQEPEAIFRGARRTKIRARTVIVNLVADKTQFAPSRMQPLSDFLESHANT
jgi:hypothetical protein